MIEAEKLEGVARIAGGEGASVVSWIKKFVRFNRRMCGLISPDHQDASAYHIYGYEFLKELAENGAARVLDIGAGQNWFFASELKDRFGFELIGQDISKGELDANPDLDVRIVSDACTDLSVEDGSIDIITARATVEHLHDNQLFLKNCAKALKPGGVVILTFAGRYAPFAILNRAFPEKLSRFLLAYLNPDATEKLGFRAYYNICTKSGIEKAAKNAGLRVARSFSYYYSSDYFAFFFPLFFLSVLYDHFRYLFGMHNVASYYAFVLRKGERSIRSM